MSKSVKVLTELEMKYDLFGGGEALLIVLHGYSQSKEKIRDRMSGLFSRFQGKILYISGPFLIPQVTPDGYKEGYSWYFYHAPTNTYISGMETAIKGICQIIKSEGLEETPKIVLGYSQGGYLAPFLGEELQNVLRVVGLSCRFRHDERTSPFPFPIVGVHGENDEVVEIEPSKASFEKLKALGQEGEYVVVPNEGHKITDLLIEPISNFLKADL